MDVERPISPDELLAFISQPASYPHRPETVDIVQTHASYVALAGSLVFKIKKPVNFGFLDFSTLAKRKHFAEEEVRLNRRLCTRIYEGVIPIYRRGGVLGFEDVDEDEENGSGDIVEYAVKMRRLESGHFLQELLAERAEPSLLDPVIDTLTGFYNERVVRPEVTEWGRPDRLRISTDENFDQTETYVPEIIAAPAFEAIRRFTDGFYEVNRDLLERRCREGRILDCHGDLHTEHIHISSEGVCVYDCIEFSERLRYIDVANDVAFLAMDLDYIDHPHLARYVVEQIAEQMDDVDFLRLADFYKCYRAYVRGKVEALTSSEHEVPEEKRDIGRTRARRYFQLALRYAVIGSAPVVLVVMGGVGTGKSTQAAAVSDLIGVGVVSSDRVRKQIADVPLFERGDDETRERLYSDAMTERTYAAMQKNAVENARKGYPTILDATFSSAPQRRRIQDEMRNCGIPVRFVELQAAEASVRDRLSQRTDSREAISDARSDDYDMLQARFEPPTVQEGIDLLTVSSETDPSETTSNLLDALVGAELSDLAASHSTRVAATARGD